MRVVFFLAFGLGSIWGYQGADSVESLNAQAAKANEKREFENAFQVSERACGLAQESGDRKGAAVCHHNSAVALIGLYRVEEAIPRFRQSIQISEELGDRAGMVRSLSAAAGILIRSGQSNLALTFSRRAVEEAERGGDKAAIAQSNSTLANIYRNLGRFTEAVQCLEKAVELLRDLPSMERQTSVVLNNLGAVYYDQHDMDLAISYHQQALVLREKAHSPPNEIAGITINLALDFQMQGKFDQSLKYFDHALQLADQASDLRMRELALYNSGMTYHRMGNGGEARKRLGSALELTKRTGDRRTAVFAETELAEIAVDEKRYAEALPLSESGIEFGRAQSEPRTLIRGLDVRGVALQMLGRDAEAQVVLDEAIALTERVRDELPGEQQGLVRFMGEETSPYQHMIDFQVSRNRPERALAYAERTKGRALIDILQSGRIDITKAMSAEEREQEAALARAISRLNEQILEQSRREKPDRKRITELGMELEKARTGYRSFEVSLYAAHPQLKVQRVAFEPVAPAELIASIPDPKTALLEYVLTDDGRYLFVLTRGAKEAADLRVYKLAVKADALARDVTHFREQIATRDLDYRKLAVSLYHELLEPAREQLRGKSTLVIVPDGVLWQLPFQALEGSPDRHLLQDFAIFYTPSLSVLHEMQRVHLTRKVAQQRLLAVEAANLPSSQREVEGLRQVYGSSNVQVYKGAAADEDMIRSEAPKYQVVHLQAHGVFQDGNPMSSYVVLAKAGKAEAGVLEAREIMGLDLHADMVVLSGCETGRGNAANSEGLIGMSWALFIAGSPSTVASQWKVESASTAQLMLGFHRNVQHESKAKALQQSALAVMKNPEYRHPFYWSGFVVMGQGF